MSVSGVGEGPSCEIPWAVLQGESREPPPCPYHPQKTLCTGVVLTTHVQFSNQQFTSTMTFGRLTTWQRSRETESAAFARSSPFSWKMIFHHLRFDTHTVKNSKFSFQLFKIYIHIFNSTLSGDSVWSGSFTTCLPHKVTLTDTIIKHLSKDEAGALICWVISKLADWTASLHHHHNWHDNHQNDHIWHSPRQRYHRPTFQTRQRAFSIIPDSSDLLSPSSGAWGQWSTRNVYALWCQTSMEWECRKNQRRFLIFFTRYHFFY